MDPRQQGLKSRREVEEDLAISQTSVRRLEKGALTVHKDASGRKWYEPQQVEMLARMFDQGMTVEAVLEQVSGRLGGAFLDEDEGEVAARVFGLLSQGLAPVEIVVEEELSPTVVYRLATEYCRLSALDFTTLPQHVDQLGHAVRRLVMHDIVWIGHRLERLEEALSL